MRFDDLKPQIGPEQESRGAGSVASEDASGATVNAIHDAADACRDAQDMLAMAANRLKGYTTSEVSDALFDMARRHADMVEDLAEEAVRLGGRRPETGTLSGTVRRLYAAADAVLSDDESEPDALLRHLSRMEEHAAVRIRKVRGKIDDDRVAERVGDVLGRIELARAGLDSLLGTRTE